MFYLNFFTSCRPTVAVKKRPMDSDSDSIASADQADHTQTKVKFADQGKKRQGKITNTKFHLNSIKHYHSRARWKPQ